MELDIKPTFDERKEFTVNDRVITVERWLNLIIIQFGENGRIHKLSTCFKTLSLAKKTFKNYDSDNAKTLFGWMTNPYTGFYE